uniref:WAP domain-containing protein n=1 Tax=Aquila chrysaetos chrysaetos TaxID=223781 RepID=A0A663EAR8_AQUCH
APTKPGACPVVLRGSLGPCLELCDTDGDCPGAAKCCTTGCGHTPRVPSLPCPRLSPPGQGRHPFGCTHPPSGLPLSRDPPRGQWEYGHPAAVPMGQELGEGLTPCRQGNPHPSFSRRVPARPGLCPPVADGDRAAECLLLCLQDKECPPGQKCCLRGCGRACVPPLRGKPPPQPATSWVPAAWGTAQVSPLQQVQPGGD